MKHWVLAACAIVLGAAAALADPAARTINVTGEGRVDTAPDMASISLGVTHQAKAARDAMNQTSDGVARILTRLTEMGIAGQDVQTSGLSLGPVWNNRYGSSNEAPRITGFEARNTVQVRVRDLARLGEVLDAVVTDGANDLNGLRFGLQTPEPVLNEARRRAVDDAMARAQLFAEAAGVTLGPLLSMSEHSGRGQPAMMEMAAARDGGIPIAAGEVGMTASVSMVFGIAE